MPCALLLLLLSLGHDLAAKQEKIVCAMTIKKRFTEPPGNRLIHSRKKKNFGRPPRELQCSDRAQTSTTGSGRPSCIDVVLGFWLKVLRRRDKFENRRKNHNYTYTYLSRPFLLMPWTIDLFIEYCSYSRVTKLSLNWNCPGK